MAGRDLYDLLDVSPEASPEELRSAWRFQLQAFHSDRFAGEADKARAEERSKLINGAYAVLRDPAQRARYDAERRAGRGRDWTMPDDGGEAAGDPARGPYLAPRPPTGYGTAPTGRATLSHRGRVYDGRLVVTGRELVFRDASGLTLGRDGEAAGRWLRRRDLFIPLDGIASRYADPSLASLWLQTADGDGFDFSDIAPKLRPALAAALAARRPG